MVVLESQIASNKKSGIAIEQVWKFDDETRNQGGVFTVEIMYAILNENGYSDGWLLKVVRHNKDTDDTK